MTSPSDNSRADDERLRDILERTYMGVGEDLDEMRDELVEQFQQFESQFDELGDEMPDWLDLPDGALRDAFELPESSPAGDSLIGPRTVAVAAGDIESFVSEWLDGGDEMPVWNRRNDPEAISCLHDELRELEDELGAIERAVDELADEGPFQLEQTLESVVFELESQRETDVEALESLIQSGDLDAGRDAREEIAELWEEQRRRVDRLRDLWDEVLNLHHRGTRKTLEGLSELRELLSRILEGLIGAEILAPPPEDETASTTVVDVEPSPTEPITNANTEELDDPPDDTADAVEPPSDETSTTPRTVDMFDDTAPADTKGPDTVETADMTPSASPSPTEPKQSKPIPSTDEPAAADTVSSNASSEPTVSVRTYRVRRGWQKVGLDEVAAALATPGLFVFAMFAMSVLSLFEVAPNPIETWDWALWAVWGAMGLLVVLPAVFRWQPMWHKAKFCFVRRGATEEEADLSLADDELTFDRTNWSVDEIRDVRLRRLDADIHGSRGWLLIIEPPYRSPIRLAAAVDDTTEWANSDAPIADPTDVPWRLPPGEFDAIRRRLRQHFQLH